MPLSITVPVGIKMHAAARQTWLRRSKTPVTSVKSVRFILGRIEIVNEITPTIVRLAYKLTPLTPR